MDGHSDPFSGHVGTGETPTVTSFACRLDTDERRALEDELMTLWGHINAATFRFLKLLAEFDRNECWNGAGITSCAHWLNVFCGIGTVAAREKVRVARALEALPKISESFRNGEISYSKVRAMTRIATPAIEESLLNIARHGTASHLACLVKRFRAVERREEAEQACEIHRERYLRTYHEEDGTLVLQARLPAEVGAIIVRAIETAMALEEQARQGVGGDTAEAQREDPKVDAPTNNDAGVEPAPVSALTHARARPARKCDTAEAQRPTEAEEQPYDPIGARRADALKHIAGRFLAEASTEDTRSSADRYQIVVHIDQALLSQTRDPEDPLELCELEAGPRLALDTARRLACDASLIGLVEAADGTPLDVGRKTRAIPRPLMRALKARDRGCRFPGCERHRHTDIHHIVHWADGGETKPGNLVTLCTYHHQLLHEGGFGVEVDPAGELLFRRPDGRPVLESATHPARFRGSASADPNVSKGTNANVGTRTDTSTTVLARFDREIEHLIAINASFGLDIEAGTARTRWCGERMDYSQAIEAMYFEKHGRL